MSKTKYHLFQRFLKLSTKIKPKKVQNWSFKWIIIGIFILYTIFKIRQSEQRFLITNSNVKLAKPVVKLTYRHPKRNVSKIKTSAPFQLNIHDRDSIIKYIEDQIKEAVEQDKGTGCAIPYLDPFSDEALQFTKVLPKIVCKAEMDWVNCYLSECRVMENILNTTRDVNCTYRDIAHVDDRSYTIGPPKVVAGAEIYTLTSSDHVVVRCRGISNANSSKFKKWSGIKTGFRASAEPPRIHPGREKSYDVLILAFDSTAKNSFIRYMPISYKVLTEELGATIMEYYNIVGEDTQASLFPILSGRNELEFPEGRYGMLYGQYLDVESFIFHKLKINGYRTAFFEDILSGGTFQGRLFGFPYQPADHYLQSFFTEAVKTRFAHNHCLGDTPQFKLMLNLTDQFFHLDGKHFCFTFIGDVSHEDINLLSTADDDLAEFLRSFKAQDRLNDTMLIVMGDHGPRAGDIRSTLQGKLEERLPLMAIVLPEDLKRVRPDALRSLQRNAHVLSTPHDVHATVLDVLNLTQYWNPYKVPGSSLKRGLTLLEQPPRLPAEHPAPPQPAAPPRRGSERAGCTRCWAQCEARRHRRGHSSLPLKKVSRQRPKLVGKPPATTIHVPPNRSCSEAGMELHWCACLKWINVTSSHPLYTQSVNALVKFVNSVTKPVRSKCLPLKLNSTDWVIWQRHNKRLLSFQQAEDESGYIAQFDEAKMSSYKKLTLMVKVTLNPGASVYEALMTYSKGESSFIINPRDVSRIYPQTNDQKSSCLSHKYRHLVKFCYCRLQCNDCINF